ncbi:penicillin-binding protein [Purpureocillium lavendulum]|uniref:Penicillin-binding protein n=1 Tax=Purpureocillium lavendulum TaxID=1247861 RepID=A0AB34FRS8_9HYPO|nr:penicillin-binding protein [Purpureocillium lavendulum]
MATDKPQESQSPLTEDFNKFVTGTMEKWNVPGMSLAVVDGDDVYSQGYGYATLPDVKATPDTLWYAASTTKAQIAATLAHLIDSKKHPELANGWSTPISTILRDEFVLHDEWATTHVTLEDAVCHRSGLPRHDSACARTVDGKQCTPSDLVRNMRNLTLTEEPRVKFQYCNLMYITLGRVIEVVTGKALGEALHDVIWGPLGMDSTYLYLQEAQDAPSHFASGYYWDKTAKEFKTSGFMGTTELAGAGAVISTVQDYTRWLKCLLHEKEPFSKDVHKDIKTPRMLVTTEPTRGADIVHYGLGWARKVYRGHVIYSHSGGMHAYGAQVYWVPAAKFGAVAFANTSWSSNAIEDVVIYRLIEDKLGIPTAERFDFDGDWAEKISQLASELPLDEAEKTVFPDKPKDPLPSTFNTAELVGTYSDPGYGEMSLHEQPHPDKPGQSILVADRSNMTWEYQLKLYHVSGDYWMVHLNTLRNPTFLNEYQQGEFRRGIDGKVSALEVKWMSRVEGAIEGRCNFKKIS